MHVFKWDTSMCRFDGCYHGRYSHSLECQDELLKYTAFVIRLYFLFCTVSIWYGRSPWKREHRWRCPWRNLSVVSVGKEKTQNRVYSHAIATRSCTGHACRGGYTWPRSPVVRCVGTSTRPPERWNQFHRSAYKDILMCQLITSGMGWGQHTDFWS